jgi:hypothetical protein
MRHLAASTLLFLTAFFIVPCSAQQAITQCPTSETAYSDSQFRTWAVCLNSDFSGNTYQLTGSIKSVADCNAKCAAANGYTKCVFDHKYNYCHVKSNNDAPWSSNTLFDSMRLLNIPDRTSMDECLAPESTITDNQGRIWTICPGSDFWRNTIQGVQSQSMADCQSRCSSNNDCKRAVFDKKAKYCHLKGDGQTWMTSTATFDTVRLTSNNVPDRQAITTCPGTETTVSDTQGRSWIICPQSDFCGNSLQVIASVKTINDCKDRCAAYSGCQRAVFDKTAFYCHLKTDGQDWRSSTETFDTVRLAAGSGSGSGSRQIPADWKCSGNGQQSPITTTDGSTWALCTSTDWQGSRNIYAIDSFQTSQACAEMCASTPICKTAIWDKANKLCAVKDSNENLVQAGNQQYDQLRLIEKAPPVSRSPSSGGKWGDKIVFPIVPAAAYLVPQ